MPESQSQNLLCSCENRLDRDQVIIDNGYDSERALQIIRGGKKNARSIANEDVKIAAACDELPLNAAA